MRVLIASDISCHYFRDVIDRAYAQRVYRELKPLFAQADCRIANLESPVCEAGTGTPIRKGGPNLFALPRTLAVLTEPGIDCAVLANNHFGDYGQPAIESTLALLKENHIASVGGGLDIESAYRAWRFEKDGVRLSVLAVCENEYGGAGEHKAGSAVYQLPRLKRRIDEEKTQADFVIVIFHGGNEYDPLPSPATAARYRFLIDLGADAVIGMHTHCMQGHETYRGKPIVYSMGNFFFPAADTKAQPRDPWNWGYLSQLDLQKGRPIQLTVHPYALQDNTLLRLLTGKEKETILSYIDRLSAYLADGAALQRFFDAWCAGRGTINARSHLHYHPEYEADEMQPEMTRCRSMLWCEAHYAVMKNLLQLEFEGRFDEAKKDFEALTALQRIPL